VWDWWQQVDGKAPSLIKPKTAFDWQNRKKKKKAFIGWPNQINIIHVEDKTTNNKKITFIINYLTKYSLLLIFLIIL